MRHRMHQRKLGRTSAHRKAMFRNQLVALFEHERIITTLPKAKELRPIAERMVTLARTGTLADRRRVLTMVPDKAVVRKLFDDIAPRFMERPGGYTRIVRLGRRRGDGAELAIIEFVDYVLEAKEGGGDHGKPSLMDRARGMFGGKKKAEEAGETPAEPEAAAAEAEPEEEEAAAPEAAAGPDAGAEGEVAPEPEAAEKPTDQD